MKKLSLFIFLLYILPVFGQNEDFRVCKNRGISFSDSVTSQGVTPIEWNWEFIGGTPSIYKGRNTTLISYSDTGLFLVKCTVLFSDSTLTVRKYYIRVFESQINHTPLKDTSICLGSILKLNPGDPQEGMNYLWTSPDAEIPGIFQETKSLSITQPGTYILRMFNICNSTSDTVYVKPGPLHCRIYVHLPSVFTPNKNLKNDKYRPITQNLPSNITTQMLIFNRWGERLYETYNLDEGWDGEYRGKPCMPGVYVCILNIDGNPTYSSTFYLLR